MGLFQKVSRGATQLFSKSSGNQNIFKKIGDYGQHINNHVQKVGHFLKPIADGLGYGHILDAGLNMSNRISNNLEK